MNFKMSFLILSFLFLKIQFITKTIFLPSKQMHS